MSKNVIVTPNRAISEEFVERFSLGKEPIAKTDVVSVYANERLALVFVEAPTNFFELVKTLSPERVYYADFAESANGERRLGDVVLPNAFFPMDPALRASGAVNDKNRADFGSSEAEFLEHYPTQGDYDFKAFGLSVGGVCVSTEGFEDFETLAKIQAVYGADMTDRNGFLLVREAAIAEMKSSFYPIFAITEGIVGVPGEISGEQAAKNVAVIFAFLEDNFGGNIVDESELPEEATLIDELEIEVTDRADE